MKYSTQYLYNCSPSEFADLPYKQALQFKYDAANRLITQLVAVHYYARDDERLNAVFDARKHCAKLLEEINECFI